MKLNKKSPYKKVSHLDFKHSRTFGWRPPSSNTYPAPATVLHGQSSSWPQGYPSLARSAPLREPKKDVTKECGGLALRSAEQSWRHVTIVTPENTNQFVSFGCDCPQHANLSQQNHENFVHCSNPPRHAGRRVVEGGHSRNLPSPPLRWSV